MGEKVDAAMFANELRKKMAEIKKRRIWQKANLVLEKFGDKHTSEKDCYTTEKTVFERTVAGRKLKILRESYGQFHKNYGLNIIIDGTSVFKADDTICTEKLDPRITLKFGRKTIEILRYQSGNWTSLLNLKKIEKSLRPKKEKESPSPVTKFRTPDKELAYRFGIKVDSADKAE